MSLVGMSQAGCVRCNNGVVVSWIAVVALDNDCLLSYNESNHIVTLSNSLKSEDLNVGEGEVKLQSGCPGAGVTGIPDFMRIPVVNSSTPLILSQSAAELNDDVPSWPISSRENFRVS